MATKEQWDAVGEDITALLARIDKCLDEAAIETGKAILKETGLCPDCGNNGQEHGCDVCGRQVVLL